MVARGLIHVAWRDFQKVARVDAGFFTPLTSLTSSPWLRRLFCRSDDIAWKGLPCCFYFGFSMGSLLIWQFWLVQGEFLPVHFFLGVLKVCMPLLRSTLEMPHLVFRFTQQRMWPACICFWSVNLSVIIYSDGLYVKTQLVINPCLLLSMFLNHLSAHFLVTLFITCSCHIPKLLFMCMCKLF